MRGARRLTRSEADAEDLVQATVVRAMERHRDLRDASKLRGWLLRVQRSVHLNSNRGLRGRLEVIDGGRAHDEPPHELRGDLESEILGRSFEDGVRASLDELPSSWRDALLLREVEELSYEEIARVQGCPVGTVRSRLAALDALFARRRLVVLAYGVFACVSVGVLVTRIGRDVLPKTDAGQFQVRPRAPEGTRMEETEKKLLASLHLVEELVGKENVTMSRARRARLPPRSAARPVDALPTIDIDVDRQRAAQLGVDLSDVARSLVASTSSSRFTDKNTWIDGKKGLSYNVQVEVPESKMASLDSVGETPSRSAERTTARWRSSATSDEAIVARASEELRDGTAIEGTAPATP